MARLAYRVYNEYQHQLLEDVDGETQARKIHGELVDLLSTSGASKRATHTNKSYRTWALSRGNLGLRRSVCTAALFLCPGEHQHLFPFCHARSGAYPVKTAGYSCDTSTITLGTFFFTLRFDVSGGGVEPWVRALRGRNGCGSQRCTKGHAGVFV